jgi:para-aminobenzoate synthetase component 1
MKTLRWYSPPENLRDRFLIAGRSFPYLAWLDSNLDESDTYGQFEFLAGWGRVVCADLEATWPTSQFRFGGFSYPFLNQTEPIGIPLRPARIDLPECFFFDAEVLLYQNRGSDYVLIQAANPESIQSLLAETQVSEFPQIQLFSSIHSGISKDDYEQKVNQLKDLIREGEVYEANLSRSIYFEGSCQNPSLLFSSWIANSPVPFSAFLKWQEVYVFSASPERFLACQGNQLISQPIKGTAKRFPEDEGADAASKESLQNSEKDKAENVMIVDLVRNDLNKSCVPGSVRVPELFGLHRFPWVYHLVSTVTGELRADISRLQALKNAFPPGSMTGAPKVSAMKIIETLEPEGRGLFAGCLGYIAPNGDFDFNVVIRTLIYDHSKQLFSYHAGGAVTIDSEAEAEYQETIHKSANLLSWLQQISE